MAIEDLNDILGFEVDYEQKRLSVRFKNAPPESCPLGSPRAFEVLTRVWLVSGWEAKLPYTFTWLGRPIIQLPDDMIRMQELIYQLRPTCIVETGVAHGGSLIFYASLLKLLHGTGVVIGVDCDIRKHNRQAIETHPLATYVRLVEGNSISPEIVAQVSEMTVGHETVLVVLDSNHSAEHVFAELSGYSPLVSMGSYIVATDGIAQDVAGMPRGSSSWKRDNPLTAIDRFLKERPDFCEETPKPMFNESPLSSFPTHWPRGWLKRTS